MVEKKIFKCNQCNDSELTFKSASALKNHMKRSTKPHPEPYFSGKCYFNDTCQTKFYSNKSMLNEHLMSPKHKFKPCPKPNCDDVMSAAKNLASHLRNKHSSVKTFKCNNCQIIFASKEECRNHEMNCKTDEKTCSKCGKIFKTLRGLKHHDTFLHGDKMFLKNHCDFCPKTFTQPFLLPHHMEACHPEELKEILAKVKKAKKDDPQLECKNDELRCEFCEITFDSEESKKNHKKQHRCHHCNKVFKSPMLVQKHLRFLYKPQIKSLKNENDELSSEVQILKNKLKEIEMKNEALIKYCRVNVKKLDIHRARFSAEELELL